MKRFLITGFLGAILGIVIGGAPADASLISRSFLDQALTDYATNTALDLKANKADLTDLSDKIGTLPDGLTVANLYNDWTDSDGYHVLGLRILEAKNIATYNPRTGKLNETTDHHMGGLLGMLYQLFSSNGYEIADEVIAPFWY